MEMDVEKALKYYALVKEKIGETVLWNQFKQVMQLCKNRSASPCVILAQLAKVFHDYPDLLEGFGMFLPGCYKEHLTTDHKKSYDCLVGSEAFLSPFEPAPAVVGPSSENIVPSTIRDSSVSHIAKYGSYNELAFFDKVRKALGYQEVYENFLHCLELYIDDHLTRLELVKTITPFLSKFPCLMKEFKDILHLNENGINIEPIPHNIAYREKLDEETILDIDYCAGKRYNASYRPLPRQSLPSSSSDSITLCDEDSNDSILPDGTELCSCKRFVREEGLYCNHMVLNDTWVSFPAWSEDSTFGTSSKTKYEETMYRIEDERFELDMAIQTNAYVIDVLSNVQKKIQNMTEEEKTSFVLDDTLGGTSSILNYRFIHRIYGDRTKELMDGLKRNPVVAVPIVLNRLRVREKEWKEVQEKYNGIWSDQIKRIYLKSLDHQGVNFKQTDAKGLRPKTLLNEIETFYQEKKQKIVEGSVGGYPGPHITNEFPVLEVFKDAVDLILQDIKKQSGIYKVDRRHIGELLNFFVANFFVLQPDGTDFADKETEQSCVVDADSDKSPKPSPSRRGAGDGGSDDEENVFLDKSILLESIGKKTYQKLGVSGDKIKLVPSEENRLPYSMFFVNNTWYIFFRLFSVLIERLGKLYVQSLKMEAQLDKNVDTSSEDYLSPYQILVSKVSTLLNGKAEFLKFEDEMRALFTIHAYVSYTLDKVIHAIVKQLHVICSDDICKKCLTYYVVHVINTRNVTCPWLVVDAEHAYEKKVVQTIGEDNCYKIVWVKKKHLLAIELLDTAKKFTEQPVDSNMSDYLDTYLKEDVVGKPIPKPSDRPPVILARNLRKQHIFWEKRLKKQIQSEKEMLLNTKFKVPAPPPTKSRRLKRKRSVAKLSDDGLFKIPAIPPKSGFRRHPRSGTTVGGKRRKVAGGGREQVAGDIREQVAGGSREQVVGDREDGVIADKEEAVGGTNNEEVVVVEDKVVGGSGGREEVVVIDEKDDDEVLVISSSRQEDVIFCGNGEEIIIGGNGEEIIIGEEGEVIIGSNGEEIIIGSNGEEVIIGEDGEVIIAGGEIIIGGDGEEVNIGDYDDDDDEVNIGSYDEVDLGSDEINVDGDGKEGNIVGDGKEGNIGGDDKVDIGGDDKVDIGGDGKEANIGCDDKVDIGGDGKEANIGGNGKEATIGGDGKEATIGGDGKEATIGGDGKEATIGGDGKEATIGGDGKEATIGGDDKVEDIGGDDKVDIGSDGTETNIGRGGDDEGSGGGEVDVSRDGGEVDASGKKVEELTVDRDVKKKSQEVMKQRGETSIECADAVDLRACSSAAMENLDRRCVMQDERRIVTNQGYSGGVDCSTGSMGERGVDASVGEPLPDDDDDEDSIKVSAEDLLFHLSQTGMAIFDHFPGSFVAATSNLASQRARAGYLMQHRQEELDSPEIESADPYAMYDDDDGCEPGPSGLQYNRNTGRYEQKYYEESEDCHPDSPPGMFLSPESYPIEDKFVEPKVEPGLEVESPDPVPCSPKKSPAKKKGPRGGSRSSGKRKRASKGKSRSVKAKPMKSLDPVKVEPETPTKEEAALSVQDVPSEQNNPVCADVTDTTPVSVIPRYIPSYNFRRCLEFSTRDVIINDNCVCIFDSQTSRMRFTTNTADYMYRRGSLFRARKEHRDYTARVTEKFGTWHRIWLERYVTTNMLKACLDWLMRSEFDKYRVDCVTVNEKVKPPYNPYTKYFIRRLKRRRSRR